MAVWKKIICTHRIFKKSKEKEKRIKIGNQIDALFKLYVQCIMHYYHVLALSMNFSLVCPVLS